MIPLYTQEEYEKAKSTDLLLLKCEHCGKVFGKIKKLITQELTHKLGICKFCSKQCRSDAQNTSIKVHCCNCDKEITITKKVFEKSENKHFFCNHSCSAEYNNKNRKITNETKEKISKSVIKWHEQHNQGKRPKKEKKREWRKERICVVCGKHYYHKNGVNTEKTCSKECSEYRIKNHKEFLSIEAIEAMSKSGRKSILNQGENRRSKNEKYFCELCEKRFKDVKHNEPIFNGWDADIIIEDIKVAVLWNGKWHYQKIRQ